VKNGEPLAAAERQFPSGGRWGSPGGFVLGMKARIGMGRPALLCSTQKVQNHCYEPSTYPSFVGLAAAHGICLMRAAPPCELGAKQSLNLC